MIPGAGSRLLSTVASRRSLCNVLHQGREPTSTTIRQSSPAANPLSSGPAPPHPPRLPQQQPFAQGASTGRVAIPVADLFDLGLDDSDSTACLHAQHDSLSLTPSARGLVASTARNGHRSRAHVRTVACAGRTVRARQSAASTLTGLGASNLAAPLATVLLLS